MYSRLFATTAAIVVLISAFSSRPAHAQNEASKVRILVVVDTLDKLGAWWEQDGVNMEAIFKKAFDAQGLRGRYTIDFLTGTSVHPAEIKKYYQNLRTGPNETLVFYYSGHGGYHRSDGHFLALKTGGIYRSEITALMKKHKPRLGVILTDCCATYTNSVRRPSDSSGMRGARNIEPRVQFVRVNLTRVNKRPPALRKEPPVILRGAAGAKKKPSPTLQIQKGRAVSFLALLNSMDGKALRHLFFGAKGFVDINGSRRGTPSLGGPPRDGGSFFTRGLVLLQPKERFPGMDKNRDNRLQWSELYESVRQQTESLTGGKQSPEAWLLPGGKFVPPATVARLISNLNSQERRLQFNLKAGTRYTISMNSEKFDTYLRLLDSRGNQVAIDDDGGSGLNSKLMYSPRATGTYTLVCTSFSKNGRGDFELTLSPPPAAAGSKRLKTVQGNLNGKEYRITFPMTAGTRYIISMNSKAFDTYLRLLDPTSRLVESDDDSGSGLNARMEYTAQSTGAHTIICTSYQYRGRGPFTLTVSAEK